MKIKFKSAVSILIVCCVVLNSTQVSAQKEKGQSVVTGGVGYSMVGLIFSALKSTINNNAPNANVKATAIPVIMGAYDFGISDKFSVGVSYTYQSLSLQYDQYQKDSIMYYGDFKDKLTRQNFGLRPLFHFGDNESLDTYFGARLSFTKWRYSTSTRNTIEDFGNSFENRPRFQALFGTRYFFNDFIGFNFELAIGPSYFALFGINLKF